MARPSSLRALGFAEGSGEWQRSQFEWLKVGGELSLTGEVNEKPLHLKMNNLMAAPRGSNVELWKASADSSSHSQGEDAALDAPKETRFLLKIGWIVGGCDST